MQVGPSLALQAQLRAALLLEPADPIVALNAVILDSTKGAAQVVTSMHCDSTLATAMLVEVSQGMLLLMTKTQHKQQNNEYLDM